MVILFSLIYLIQDIGIHLILNRLIFWHKRVLKEIYQFRKVLEIDILEGFLHYFTIENYQMESIVTEIDLPILRNTIEYFALVVNYLQKGTERDSWQMRGIMIGHILVLHLQSMRRVQIMF